MMKNRYLILALAALLLFSLLAGCAPSRPADTIRDGGGTWVYIPDATTPMASPNLPAQQPDAVVVKPTPDSSVQQADPTPAPDFGAAVGYPSPDPDMISQQQAMDIALEHAGVHADEADFMQIEYDIDHGRAEFDVQFYVERMEYEYEIDAVSSKILSFDKEWD